MQSLQNKHIILGLTGGIACYKAAELCRLLVKAGTSVQVVMTEAAQQFMTPVTMQALSARPVYTHQWDNRPDNNMAHIVLSRQADAIVVAPASADFMAKVLHGRADDLLSLLILARPGKSEALPRGLPLIMAPAMNREMWQNPVTQRNVRQLQEDGVHVLGVGNGEQACGEFGDGRMLEALDILDEIDSFFSPKELLGKKILITAGPTFEALDPVRGITNLSSGKMGFALARAAQKMGAEVDLVSGPVALSTPRGVKRYPVTSAQDMLATTLPLAQEADVFIATAAVADWRVAQEAREKIKKSAEHGLPTFQFIENPDILATIAASERARAGSLYCVGFAAESHDLEKHAREKRIRKGIPLIVGNIGPATFGRDDNALLLIDEAGTTALEQASKDDLAYQLLREIAQRLNAPPLKTTLT